MGQEEGAPFREWWLVESPGTIMATEAGGGEGRGPGPPSPCPASCLVSLSLHVPICQMGDPCRMALEMGQGCKKWW